MPVARGRGTRRGRAHGVIVAPVKAALLALADLGLPGIRRILLVSLLGAAAIFAASVAGFGWLAFQLTLFDWNWLNHAISLLGGLVGVVLAWLCFPLLLAAISGSLTDGVSRAVERAHYPPGARELPRLPGLLLGLRLAVVGLIANLLMLPVYLLAPGFNLLLATVLNGWLIGRGLFTLVALRRFGAAEMQVLRGRHWGAIWVMGLLIAVLGFAPVANLLSPVLATAAMTHFIERLRQRGASA